MPDVKIQAVDYKFWLKLLLPFLIPMIAFAFWFGVQTSKIQTSLTAQTASRIKFELKLDKKLTLIDNKIDGLAKSNNVLNTRMTVAESKILLIRQTLAEIKAEAARMKDSLEREIRRSSRTRRTR